MRAKSADLNGANTRGCQKHVVKCEKLLIQAINIVKRSFNSGRVYFLTSVRKCPAIVKKSLSPEACVAKS